ncbi:uncharacterized protein TNCV_4917171 [Trichonephila clavipes]|nr:uncharacterized protein TNCV_4917171 [Trichonephila clavipes]
MTQQTTPWENWHLERGVELLRIFELTTLTVTPHKSLNTCRGVISEPDLLYASGAEILEGLSDQGVTQVTKPSTATTTTQTDENITKIVCPPLKLLQPLITDPKSTISSSVAAVNKSSTSTQAELVPSTSSVTVTSPSKSQPINSVIDTVSTASDNLSISTASSSSTACSVLETTTTTFNTIPTTSQDTTQTQNLNPVGKRPPRKNQSNAIKPKIDIKTAPHRPRKSAPNEYSTDEENMIIYDPKLALVPLNPTLNTQLRPGVPPRSPTREAVCRSPGTNQARRLPGVHPEYSTTAPGRGSNGYIRRTLSAALTLQQCLFGDTEERYHQPIDRSGLTPATRLQRSAGQRAVITNFFIPELNNHDVQELWFQEDGATCHTARATIDLLKDTLGDRLISRFGPVNWPPRSCDLTPLDYFLWGYVKSLVYADKPQTLDHLEDNILRVIADIRPQMLKKVIENWTSSRGSPMPEIIFKM